MTQHINYGQLMHRALRRVMSEVLSDAGKNGLPGNHHFFVTFDSQHPGVDGPDWLLSKYPDEMTIVIQNWFEDLVVSDDTIEITLSFSNSPVRLVIPIDAVKTFVDPSVEFGLRFDAHDPEPLDDPEDDPEPEPQPEADRKSEVVSLDAFRKH